VIVNGLKIDMAVGACQLHGKLPHSTLCSPCVQQAATKKGTPYNNLISRVEEQRIGIVIDILDDGKDVIGTS
jgi:hypothetical protein